MLVGTLLTDHRWRPKYRFQGIGAALPFELQLCTRVDGRLLCYSLSDVRIVHYTMDQEVVCTRVGK